MTIRYAAKHGAGLVNTMLAIQNRRAFDAGNLSASTGISTTGSLRGDNLEALLSAVDRHALTYVVYSYQTPIAWHTDDLGWTIPDTKYSVTTSNHQGVVRRAIREA